MNISINKLSKLYSGNVRAINDISLSISNGMFGLLGPNGAGKTTLMQIMATLMSPTSGQIKYGNLVLGKDNHEIRKHIGYLPQNYGLFDRLTGEEFLEYIAIIKGIKDSSSRKRQINDLLEQLNLTDKRRKKIKTYSGGMRQRIGIAQAMIGDPKVIIVDEPTVGLDPEERVRFRNMLGDLSLNRIVILSTHIVADIETSCSDVAIMNKGNILYRGTPEELIKRVEGLLWKTFITVTEWNSMSERNRSKIVRRRLTRLNGVEGYEVHQFTTGNLDSENHEIAIPSLEDAYLALIRGMVEF